MLERGEINMAEAKRRQAEFKTKYWMVWHCGRAERGEGYLSAPFTALASGFPLRRR